MMDAERLRAVFDRAPIPTLLVTSDGEVVEANEAAYNLVGREITTLEELPTDGCEVHTASIGDGLRIVQIVDLRERIERERDLTFQANHDPLTGLLNRTGIEAALEALTADLADGAEPDRPGAVFFCDLKGFKRINDEHGHLVGDRVVATVAKRIASTVRRTDAVGRYGGDEFIVVLPRIGPEDAEETAARVVRSVQEPIVVGGIRASVGICVGAVVHDGAATPTELIGRADAAMYRAKEATGDVRYLVVRPDGRAVSTQSPQRPPLGTR